jgi:protein involved in polysaccharide export with SLBB domain
MNPFPERNGRQAQTSGVSNRGGTWMAALALFLMLLLAGCETVPEMQPSDFEAIRAATTNAPAIKPELMVLHEGDIVRVTFPGATALNAPGQTIRRDGMISIPPLGEIKFAGLTTKEAEKAILDTYGSQLQIKEVSVMLESSSFGVYVTGKVLRPGKITSDRPLTVLEAVMEAGGPDYTKANLKKVTVIRNENGRTEHHVLNLKKVLDGQSGEQFKLKAADIIYVPERFTWL